MSTLLPPAYAWLAHEPAPRHLVAALAFYGLREIVGPQDNPTILEWADELGAGAIFRSDEVPWCGLFLAKVMRIAHRDYPPAFYRALSWSTWGLGSRFPELGDVLVFTRDGGGHVGLYVGEDPGGYLHVLGGNQSNAVSIMRLHASRLSAVRRPPYQVKPWNVRRVGLGVDGSPVSMNEA